MGRDIIRKRKKKSKLFVGLIFSVQRLTRGNQTSKKQKELEEGCCTQTDLNGREMNDLPLPACLLG